MEARVQQATMAGDVEALRSLWASGESLSGCVLLAAEFNQRQVVEFLVAAGVDVGETAADGRNALHAAARRDSVDCLLVLSAHIPLWEGDSDGATPLGVAAHHGKRGAVGFFMRRKPPRWVVVQATVMAIEGGRLGLASKVWVDLLGTPQEIQELREAALERGTRAAAAWVRRVAGPM